MEGCEVVVRKSEAGEKREVDQISHLSLLGGEVADEHVLRKDGVKMLV